MKLNDNTLTVLRNFASIQPNLLVEAGDTIKTMAEARNVMCTAKLDQSFDCDFGIYDLNEFLNVLTLVDEPTLDFKEKHVVVSGASGRSSVKYFYVGDKSLLTSVAKSVNLPEFEVNFTLDESTLNRVRKASNVLGHPKLTIRAENGVIRLSVTDNEDDTSNSFSIDVAGSYEHEDFMFVMNIDNLKLIAGDYDVEVSSKLLSRFTNKTTNVEYFIALEKSSTYN